MLRCSFIASLAALLTISACTVGTSTASAAAPAVPKVVSTIPADGYHSTASDPVLIGTADPGTTVEFYEYPGNSPSFACDVMLGSGTAEAFGSTGIRVTLPRVRGYRLIYARAVDADGQASSCDGVSSWWFDDNVPSFPKQGVQTGRSNRLLLQIPRHDYGTIYTAYANDPTCTSAPIGSMIDIDGLSRGLFVATLPDKGASIDRQTTDVYVTAAYRADRAVCPAEPQLRYTQLSAQAPGGPTPTPSPKPSPTTGRVPGVPWIGPASSRSWWLDDSLVLAAHAAEGWQPDDTIEIFDDAHCSGTPLATVQVQTEARVPLLIEVPPDSATAFYLTAVTSQGNRTSCPDEPQYIGIYGSPPSPTPRPLDQTPVAVPEPTATPAPVASHAASTPVAGPTPATRPFRALRLSVKIGRCASVRAARSRGGIPFAYELSTPATISFSLTRKRSGTTHRACPKRVAPAHGAYGPPLTPSLSLVGLATTPNAGGEVGAGGLRRAGGLVPGRYRLVTSAETSDGQRTQRVSEFWVLATNAP